MTTSGDEEPSFDPRSWARKAEAAPAPPSAPPATPVRKAAKADWRLFAAGGAVLLLAVGGGALALRAGKAKAPAASETAAPATVQPAGMRRTLAIDGVAQLRETLIACGLTPAEADAAAQAAASSFTADDHDLRLELSLSQATPASLVQLEVSRPDGSGVLIAPVGGQMQAKPLASNLQTRIKVVRGEMDANSFYSSAVAAGVTDSLISDFANAFAFDFDMQREIKPGDIFEAAFEQKVNETGESVGAEKLVYVSLQTQAKSRALYRFQGPSDKEAVWYDGNGSNTARSLMRTPVEGARISSNFGTRTHPVLGYTRMHKGTDFAVAIGTPVYASGDGVVDFVGPHGGHGNFVRIRHNPTLQTGYAHLSAYGAGVTVGASVRQGQIIAMSGNTGLSSGPHLHYEVIVNGEQVDSMTYETTAGRQLDAAGLAAFRKERDRIDQLRAAQNG